LRYKDEHDIIFICRGIVNDFKVNSPAQLRGAMQVESVGSLTPRGRAMRQRIMEAAVAVFADVGYERARITDITSKCNAALGSFYRYYRASASAWIADGNRWLEHPTEAGMVEQVFAHFKAYSQHRGMLRVVREAAAAGPGSGFFRMWLQERERFVARNVRWIAAFQRRGFISTDFDAAMLAGGLSATIEQVAYMNIGFAVELPDDATLKRLAFNAVAPWFRGVVRAAPERK
jgi:AcrR family transcriptional regulator